MSDEAKPVSLKGEAVEVALAEATAVLAMVQDADRRGRLAEGGLDPDEHPVVTPIAVGTHFGGYLAVLPAGASLDVLDTRAIEHAAGIFALEMLREQSAYEVESRLKGDVLQDLFTGSYRDEDEAAGLLRRLGYTLPGAYRVARVEAAAAAGDREGRPARWQEEMQGPQSRLYSALNEVCAKILGVAAVAPSSTLPLNRH